MAATSPAASQRGSTPDFVPERSSIDDSDDRTGIARLGSPIGLSAADSYTELDEFEHAEGLRWREPPPGPHKPPRPRRDDLEILAALHELRFLTVTQIQRRFMPAKATRSVQHRLNQMFKVGWVRRMEITTGRQGHTARVYAIGKTGYELLQAHPGSTALARHMDLDAKWRAPDVEDPRLVVHDLHANAWLFALERLLARNVLRGWRGPRAARLDVPGERIRGQWVPLAPNTVPLGTGYHIADLQLDEFQPVRPDLAIELDLSLGEERRHVELLVELDRSGRASSNYEKFRRYDALLNGWVMALTRYKLLGEPPIVVFAVEDADKAAQFLRAADRIMTGRVGKCGVPEAAWPADGRRRTFVVSELDVHQGTLRAQRLPQHPPALRKATMGRGADRLRPSRSAACFRKPSSSTGRSPGGSVVSLASDRRA